MNYLKFIFSFVLTVLLAVTAIQAQTYDVSASGADGSSYVYYTGTVDMTADGDSIASHYTQALYVGDSNQSTSILQVDIPDSTGTEDINIFVEVSQNRLNWNSISTAVLDQATAGTSYDTLSTVDGSALIEFKGSTWIRLHFDGQTGNPANVIKWSAYFPKNSGAPPRGVSNVVNRRSS